MTRGTRGEPPAEQSPADPRRPPSFVAILSEAKRRLRSDPILGLPFVVAGVLVAVADAVRRWDPVPVATPDWVGETLSIQYSLFPSGPARTVRDASALVDLRSPFLVGAVGLETIVFAAVGVAGWATIARVLDAERRVGSLARYLGVLLLLGAIPELLGRRSVTVDTLPVSLLALVAISLVSVRLFLFPGFLVTGERVLPALGKSVRASRGASWALLSLVVVFGLAYWALALVPVVGGFLSTAVVAPLHALALAVVVDATESADGRLRGH